MLLMTPWGLWGEGSSEPRCPEQDLLAVCSQAGCSGKAVCSSTATSVSHHVSWIWSFTHLSIHCTTMHICDIWLVPKPGNEQSNFCGLCLRQTWSGWNSKPFIENYKLVIINKIKVKGHQECSVDASLQEGATPEKSQIRRPPKHGFQ